MAKISFVRLSKPKIITHICTLCGIKITGRRHIIEKEINGKKKEVEYCDKCITKVYNPFK